MVIDLNSIVSNGIYPTAMISNLPENTKCIFEDVWITSNKITEAITSVSVLLSNPSSDYWEQYSRLYTNDIAGEWYKTAQGGLI